MVNAMADQSSRARQTRKAVLAEWRHQGVVEAARRIFARVGYPAANVEEIAREAGMAKGTVYLYFKSKEEVFLAVLASDLESLVGTTIDSMSAATTFESQLTIFLNLRVDYLKNNRDALSIYLAEFGSRGYRSTVISDTIDRLLLRQVEFIRQCLDKAVARGEIRLIASETTAFAILDLARGFAERHLQGWARLTLDEDVACLHSFILNGLRL
jgi:AcrR family transcriptional regulator